MPLVSSGHHLCFRPKGYRLELPLTPSLGWTKLIYWLAELRETFYLVDYWFVVKGYNSGEELQRSRYGNIPSSNTPVFSNLQVFINPEAGHLGFHGGALHRHDSWQFTDHWQLNSVPTCTPLLPGCKCCRGRGICLLFIDGSQELGWGGAVNEHFLLFCIL